MTKTIYKEEQRFRRWEVIALIVLLLIGTSYHFAELFISGVYDSGPLLFQYALIAIVLVGALAYFLSIRLIVKIEKEGIRYQYYPWHYKKHLVKWEEIKNVEFVDTPLPAEWSGWAVRLGTPEHTFSVSGRTGLSLDLKDGQQLFIGTQHPDELKAALDDINKYV